MLPSQALFRDTMKALKVKLTDKVVIYDHKGTLQSTRLYWMFKAFGHQNVSLLNGGYKKWVAEGREVSKTEGSNEEADYAYTYKPELCQSIQQVHDVVQGLRKKTLDV